MPLGRTKKDGKRRILRQMDKAQKKFNKGLAIQIQKLKKKKK